MKHILWLIAALALPIAVHAQQFNFDKRVNVVRLQEELRAANYNSESIFCQDDSSGKPHCKIFWGPGGEKKDPASIIQAHKYVDLEAKRKQDLEEMRLLTKKWLNGSITATEKDRLLMLFVASSLGVR